MLSISAPCDPICACEDIPPPPPPPPPPTPLSLPTPPRPCHNCSSTGSYLIQWIKIKLKFWRRWSAKYINQRTASQEMTRMHHFDCWDCRALSKHQASKVWLEINTQSRYLHQLVICSSLDTACRLKIFFPKTVSTFRGKTKPTVCPSARSCLVNGSNVVSGWKTHPALHR